MTYPEHEPERCGATCAVVEYSDTTPRTVQYLCVLDEHSDDDHQWHRQAAWKRP